MEKFKFKEGAEVSTTSDTYYALFDGGYIVPEELLENPEQAQKVNDAVEIIRSFIDQAKDAGVIEEM